MRINRENSSSRQEVIAIVNGLLFKMLVVRSTSSLDGNQDRGIVPLLDFTLRAASRLLLEKIQGEMAACEEDQALVEGDGMPVRIFLPEDLVRACSTSHSIDGQILIALW
jgi:hypothetical protein